MNVKEANILNKDQDTSFNTSTLVFETRRSSDWIHSDSFLPQPVDHWSTSVNCSTTCIWMYCIYVKANTCVYLGGCGECVCVFEYVGLYIFIYFLFSLDIFGVSSYFVVCVLTTV